MRWNLLKIHLFIVAHSFFGVTVSGPNVSTIIDHGPTVQSTTAKYAWHRKSRLNQAESVTSQNPTIKPKMATPCETPNGDPAYCVEFQKCPLLFHQLNNSDAHEFLRKSQCGPENQDPQQPKVCCGKYDNYKQNATPKNPLPKKCGNQNVSMKGRIFGGEEALLGEFPWMARLIHRNRFGYKTFGCSGFLIHSKYVLTAAHCLLSDNLETLGEVVEVQLGEHNTQTEIDCNSQNTTCADHPQTIRVFERIVHQNYDQTSSQHHHDIALLHLNKGAKMSDYVSPICLLEDSNEAFEYWLSGWGKTEIYGASPVKMKVSLPPFSWEECAQKYNLIDVVVTRKQICAGGIKIKDSCSGDSGGPLMVPKNGNHWYAAGIVSYGLGCAREGWPGVYTNVRSYVGWIKQQINKGSITDKNKKKTTVKSKL